MIRNYIRIARNVLFKDKVVSAINIFGLGLGLSLCLIVITILRDQFSFDQFHKNAGNIYRINTEVVHKNGDKQYYATTFFPLSVILKEKYPFVNNVIRLTSGFRGSTTAAGKSIAINGLFTDPKFFDLFSFEWLYGNKSAALTEPDCIVLSQETSEKFFGKRDPVGEVMEVGELGHFRITGVLKKPSTKTHLMFDALGSNLAVPLLEKQKKIDSLTQNFKNYFSTYVYVLVNGKRDASALRQALQSLSKEYASANVTNSKSLYFYLQPFKKIVPGPLLSNNLGRALPIHIIWMLGIIAVLVLLASTFNYNGLFVAQSLARAKEIGFRKVAGATRGNLILQFVIQGILTSWVALIIGYILFRFLLIPVFSSLSFIQEFDVSFQQKPVLFILFIVFGTTVGFFSGLFPALYLSRLNPIKALKETPDKTLLPRFGIRRIILVVQFTLGLTFTIIIINMYRQISYLVGGNYGFLTKSILNIPLKDSSYRKISTSFLQYSGVRKVSGISHLMGTEHYRTAQIQLNKDDEKTEVQDYSIDENYIAGLQLRLIAGNDFSRSLPDDRELFVIVNEAFLRRFKIANASESIGKPLIIDDSLIVSVCGVVKDFHFKSFRHDIEPLLLRYRPTDIGYLNVQILETNQEQTLADLKKIWESVYRNEPFICSFFDDDLASNYRNFEDIGSLFGLVALFSITVSCLGVLGMVRFMIRKRMKEIAVRKVVGASVIQIAWLLAGGFLKQLFVACLIGMPISIIFMTSFLNQFTYRINPIAGYIAGIIALFAIVFSVVSSKIIYAAKVSPARSLKIE